MNIVGPLMRLTAQTTVLAAKGLWHGSVGLATASWWAGHGVAKGTGLAIDYARSRRLHADGDHVLCPRGHLVPTTGVFECHCGFVYEGSVWLCANRECKATTPFILCPTCRLAVRNPYRLQA